MLNEDIANVVSFALKEDLGGELDPNIRMHRGWLL